MEPTNGYPSVEFCYTEEDWIAGSKLYGKPTRVRWFICLACIPTLAIVVSAIFMNPTASISQHIMIGFVTLLGVFYCLFIWSVALSKGARRSFAKYPLARLTHRVTLRSEGIGFQSPRGDVNYLWKDFIRWRANEKVVLVYVAPRLFYIIPTRLAEPGFPIEELKTLLARELGLPRR
jgi:hypothetical protein